MSLHIALKTVAETEALGRALAAVAAPGTVFAISGPLGAGKTCVARGFITALQPQISEEIVSPTFTLVQTYETAAGPVWHFDLYRLKHADEAIELGFEDALADICVIEWPERLGKALPAARIDIALTHAGTGRRAAITGHGSLTEAVDMLARHLPGLEA